MTGLRRGFTLLELLIAVAVLGLVIVLLDQGVAFGLRATLVQQQRQGRQGDLEAVDRTIRQLIAAADPGVFPQPPPFRGAPASVTLVSELPTAEPQRVDAALLVAGNKLRLRWTKRRHVTLLGPPPAPQEIVLLDGVRALDMAYFDGAGWSSGWTGQRLPLLVRATLRFTDERRRWPPIEAAPAREALPR